MMYGRDAWGAGLVDALMKDRKRIVGH